MREILFRGKRFDTKEWIYGHLASEDIILTKNCLQVDYDYIGFENDWSSVIPETVGQYTGLTDKNGVKIFEGDTIRWSEWQGTGLPNGEEELAIEDYLVEFINGMFVAKCLLSRFPTHCLLTEFDLKEGKLIDTEVVGNIHDK